MRANPTRAEPPTAAAPDSWVRWREADVARAFGREPVRVRRAAREAIAGLEALAKAGRTPVTALVSDATPEVLKQYPDAPVQGSGFMYYYHCHDARETPRDEHGHFHVFARNADGSHTHLVGLGVDASGWPMRLFTTNRWVTDEAWASAPDVLVLADRVVRSHRPADALGRWLFAQLDLFRPQIEVLLRRRDARLRALRRGRARERLFEDRRVRVLSQCRVSLPQQIAVVERAA